MVNLLDPFFVTCVLMLSAWVGVVLFMILAPRRFGNLVHESFMIFPAVGPRDWGKQLFLRGAGVGLLGFAAHLAPSMLELFRE